MGNRRLIVVSFDALVYEDLDHIKQKPYFSKFWNEGSRVNRIRTIYPSLTYPAHTSILTGVTTGKHSIINNEPFIPGQKCPWFWFHDSVTAKDIHDVAKEAGLKTASLYWPVTGNHKSVDYLVDEYWPQSKDDTLEKAYKRAGTSDELFDACIRGHESQFTSFDSRITDPAEVEIACNVIKKFKPDLLTLHLTLVDSTRHEYGVFNKYVEEAAAKTEDFIGQIIEATKEAGVFEETNFVITSDHGQINYTRRMNINKLAIDKGWITLDEEQNVTDWKVWIKPACYSAHVYFKDKNDDSFKQEVFKYLSECCKAGNMGIGRVMTAEEANEEFGLDGDFSFVIESDETTTFTENWKIPLFVDAEYLEDGMGKATHGHNPNVGPQPVFLAWGPQIKKGVVIPDARIIDEAPTFAKILGLEFPEAEGHAIEAFLK